MPVQDRKVAILVAGMHRSGTSLLTRILNLVGCDLPATLMPPVPDNNETGFWESRLVADLNDEILASAGSRWNDWRAFDSDWYSSPVAGQFQDRAQTILHEQFGDSRLFALKDPRICRLMQFWVEAVGAIGAEPLVVSPVRNPLDVAASLQARDGIDPSAGCLMWLRHVLDAERTSRGLTRACLRYETLLSEVHAIVDMLGDTLGISWPRSVSVHAQIELEEFTSPDLHHHATDDAKVLSNPRLSSWIVSSFEIFDRWCRGEVREKDISKLGQIKGAFDAATPAFSRVVAVGEREISKRNERIEGLNQTLAERDGQIEGLNQTLAERDGQIDGLGQTLAERDGQIDGLGQTLAERDGQIDGLNQTLAERDGQIDGLGQTLAERDGQIDGLNQTLAERDGRIDGLNQTLAERDGRIEGLGRTLAERDGRIEGLGQTLAERDGRIEGLSRGILERDNRIEGLNLIVVERDSRIEGLDLALAERSGQIEGLGQTLAERDGQVEGLNLIVAERGHRIRTLHETLAERDNQIAELYNSHSWRISAPLRRLRRILQSPIRTVRGATSRTGRALYYQAPLPPEVKLRIKEKVFGSAPWLFRHTLAWRMWANATHPDGAEKHLPNADPIRPNLRSRRYCAASRADLADRTVAAIENDGSIPILFDPEFYLDSNEDVRNDGIDPLEHYLQWGAIEGRMPLGDIHPDELHPLVRDLHRLDLADNQASAFDCDVYRRLNPDLASLDDKALIDHYENQGRAESRTCSLHTFVSHSCGNPREIPLDFDPDEYADLYSQDLDIFNGRPLEALHHYMHRGRWEHRYYSLRALHAASSPARGSSRAATATVPPEELATTDTPALCVLAHVYYPELWNELSGYIGNLPEKAYDLYVNLVDTTFDPKLVSDIRDRFPSARIQISKNRGRDIGGHVRLLENIRIGDYRLYCLLHTKKSPQLSKAQAILWRRGLLNPLMGAKERAAENVALMLKDETIGLMAAADYRYTEIDDNEEKYEILLDRLGIGHDCKAVECVTGTMMFLRTDVLRRIFDTVRDLPFEDGSGKSSDFQSDGQWEHAVERIVGRVVRDMGYRSEWRR